MENVYFSFHKSWIVYLTIVMISFFLIKRNVYASITFNPAFLEIDHPDKNKIDLSIFESGLQLSGLYWVDIVVNGIQKETNDIIFYNSISKRGDHILKPCLHVKDLTKYGIKLASLPVFPKQEDNCLILTDIPDLSYHFQFNQQRLVLNIPQAFMENQARGYIPPTLWDEGINVAQLNYSITGNKSWGSYYDADSWSNFINIHPGLNVDGWRVRNYSTWSYDKSISGESKKHWRSVYTYAARSIKEIKSQLVIGDSYTASDLFDSLSFRGVQLLSDDDMLPDSLRGYAPIIRGVARTNAKISVRQNGYIIYQNYVPAGPFEINDLYPTGSGGNLLVTIVETDGREKKMIVPFASVPILQREGNLKYSVTMGQYRSYNYGTSNHLFMSGSAVYGLPEGYTAYGGIQLATKYQSLVAGIGKNAGNFGAFSIDLTHAIAKPQHQVRKRGQSWRMRYSKDILKTGTNLTVAAYRYSTREYYNLAETVDSYHLPYYSKYSNGNYKSKKEIVLNQHLGNNMGSLSLSLYDENYWHNHRREQSIYLSYSNSWYGVTYGLYYNYIRNKQHRYRDGDKNHIFSFNISIPLTKKVQNTYLNYHITVNKKGNTTNLLGLNGTLLEDDNLNWSVQQGYSPKGQGHNTNLHVALREAYGTINGGCSISSRQQFVNYGLSGGIVGNNNMLIFGQQLGETTAIVNAPGVINAKVSNQSGVRTDWRGYTIVPYLTPYKRNIIQISPETLSDKVDLVLTNQAVIPMRGAVVLANFKSRIGQKILMTLMQQNGKPVPFGAIVTSQRHKKAEKFIVGSHGEVYLTGLTNRGKLLVKWGASKYGQCSVDYDVSSTAPQSGIKLIELMCKSLKE